MGLLPRDRRLCPPPAAASGRFGPDNVISVAGDKPYPRFAEGRCYYSLASDRRGQKPGRVLCFKSQATAGTPCGELRNEGLVTVSVDAHNPFPFYEETTSSCSARFTVWVPAESHHAFASAMVGPTAGGSAWSRWRIDGCSPSAQLLPPSGGAVKEDLTHEDSDRQQADRPAEPGL